MLLSGRRTQQPTLALVTGTAAAMSRRHGGSMIPLFWGGITVEWRLKTKIKSLSLLIIFFSALLYYLVKPRDTALGQPLPQRLPGVGWLKTSKLCR